MRAIRRGVVLAVFLSIPALLAPTGLQGSAEGSTRYVRSVQRIAPGLKMISILDRRGPNQIKVLSVDPSSNWTFDLALARDRLPGRETTSDMAVRHGAIAATNGTFGLPWGRPIGLFARDSYLETSPLFWGNAFSLTRDQQTAFVGHPDLRVRVKSMVGRTNVVVAGWNEPGVVGGQVRAYTRAAGRFVRPPENACSARLLQNGYARWGPDGDGVTRGYFVDEVVCAQDPLPVAGGIVIAATRETKAAARISRLQVNEPVELTWSVGWIGVTEAIAGNPVVVEDGQNIAYDCSVPFCERNPRTGVGVAGDRILLVTVDGRRPGYSVGMTLRELGHLFRVLGADRALNLDGGGSTTMVVGDEVVNRPSDPGGERRVSSSILILRGADADEPTLFPPSLSPSENIGSGKLEKMGPDPAVEDAASSGGLLDAVRSGHLGRAIRDLPRPLARIVERFRTSR